MAIIRQEQLVSWDGLSVGVDVGDGVGQSEREAEGEDQKPCVGRLNAAE